MDDRRILEDYPLPIARGYLRYRDARGGSERLEGASVLFEIYLRYVASIAIAIALYLSGSERDQKVNAALKGLLHPRLEDWLGFLRECLRFFSEKKERDRAGRAMAELYRRKSSQWQQVAQLHECLAVSGRDESAFPLGASLESIVGEMGRSLEGDPISLEMLFEAFVSYRGERPALNSGASEDEHPQLADHLATAFSEILEHSPFLTARRLVSLRSTQVDGSRMKCELTEFMGLEPIVKERACSLSDGFPLPQERSLYLLSEPGELLSLEPLLVARGEDVFFLSETDGSLEYVSAATAERYRPEDPQDVQGKLFECLLGDPAPVIALDRRPSDGGLNAAGDVSDLDSEEDGRKLGDFRIVREIGRGGMGTVFEAIQESLGRRVALKVLPGNFALEPKRVERFHREARATARLHHPNIVPIHEVGETEGTHYYAMEHIEGPSLDRALDQARDQTQRSTRAGNRVKEKDTSSTSDPAYVASVVERIADLADGLAEAHKQGLVHRDVKPSNILVDPSGRYVLVDFGLVREEDSQTLTRSGEMMGTLRYMSPEQVSRRRVDGRSDVYSLALTFYEILTLRLPFDGESEHDLQHAILFKEPIPPRKWNPRLHRDLETILLHALERDPERRYASARDFTADLRRFLRYEPIKARPQSAWTRMVRRAARHRAAVVAVSTILVSLVVVTLLVLWNYREARLRRIESYEPAVLDAVMKMELRRVDRIAYAGSFASEDDQDAAMGSAGGRLDEVLAELQDATAAVPDRPDAYYHLARCLKILERDGEALENLDRALECEPHFVPALVLRSVLLTRAGRFEEARSLLEETRKSEENEWAEAFVDAHEASRRREWNHAAKAYDRLLDLQATGGEPYLGASVEMQLSKGVTCLAAKDYREAIRAFTAAQAIQPQYLEPTLLLAKAYYQDGDKEKAEEEFQKLFKRAPNGDELAATVVAIYGVLKDEEKGKRWVEKIQDETLRPRALAVLFHALDKERAYIEAAKKAIEANPRDIKLRETLAGFLLLRAGQRYEAKKVCLAGLEIDPDSIPLHNTLGIVLHREGKHAEAIAEYQGIIKRRPTYSSAYHNLASVYSSQGKLEKAIQLYLKAIDVRSAVGGRGHRPHTSLARVYRGRGQRNEAMEQYRAAIARNPEHPEPHRVLGQVFLDEERFEDAFREFATALELHPVDAPSHRQLARVLERKQPPSLAKEIDHLVETLERALESDPEEPDQLVKTVTLLLVRHPSIDDRQKIRDYAERLLQSEAPFRDTEIFLTLAEDHFERGEREQAVQILERALSFPSARQIEERRLEAYREAILPDLASYASIDALLASTTETLIGEGASWKYFKGTSEPPAEWVELAFDDDSWQSGISGFGYGDADDATVLEDMRGNYSTLYVRHVFEVPDPGRYPRLRLSVRVDDGFVAYVNGTEVRRLRLGTRPERLPWNALSDWVVDPVEEITWFPADFLKAGRNVLAIQGINGGNIESSDFSLIPVLEGALFPSAARDREVLEKFRALGREDTGARIAYFEGRLLQREGKHAEAAERFRTVLTSDETAAEPYLRFAESLRDAGKPKEAEMFLRKALEERFAQRRALWHLWFGISLKNLRRRPVEVLAALPMREKDAGEAGSETSGSVRLYGDEIRWLLEQLRDVGAVRINSGGREYRGADGVVWGEDRFFSGPLADFSIRYSDEIEGADDDTIYQTIRHFRLDATIPTGYRLPLPPGRYRVTLHFVEWHAATHNDRTLRPWRRNFDVYIEGKRERRAYEVSDAGFATADRQSFEVSLDDGVLDIEFVRRVQLPLVCAIEVEVAN